MKFIAGFLLLPFLAQAQTFPRALQDIQKKQEIKRENRWTIYDWLAAKAKFRMMDRWLALNSSDTEFEMFQGGAASREKVTGDGTEGPELDGLRGELGLFYSIFGVTGFYEDIEDREFGWGAALNLRLLGTSMQNSNFTVSYGGHWRKISGEEFENQYAAASLTFYILKFLGISGAYRFYLPAETDAGVELSGRRVEGTLFFDLSFLRIYGTWFQEPLEFKDAAGAVSEDEREGMIAGVQLYF